MRKDVNEVLSQALTKKKRKMYSRRFTVQALVNCELLTLTVGDLDKMRIEFFDIYSQLWENSRADLKIQLKQKKNLFKECLHEEERSKSTKFAQLLFKKKDDAHEVEIKSSKSSELIFPKDLQENSGDEVPDEEANVLNAKLGGS